MKFKIALVGNPNSGKTTLFNQLTGSKQYVGNWPGVTVEKKSGLLKKHSSFEIIDLPGIYSLSPYTNEEIVTRDFLVNEKPDLIINIVDSTNIERNLYLTTQLMEVGIPVVVALNMIDTLQQQGKSLDVNLLQEKLGCTVYKISASKNIGVSSMIANIVEQQYDKDCIQSSYHSDIEAILKDIEEYYQNEITHDKRYFAIKIFEKDENILKKYPLKAIALEKIEAAESIYQDTSEGIIANQRYEYIEAVLKDAYHKIKVANDQTSKIDKILTNRYLGIPIFGLIMFGIYFLAISSIGAYFTDWMNDVLFGDILYNALQTLLVSLNTAAWLNSLILDGILLGVGAVLGFVPQIAILFLLISILEDTGYMARIAFMLDRVFRYFNLSGKSIIPMLIGTGCSVPGIMASRTIEQDSDRRLTVITTSFIPCSAKIPVIGLIAGALFNGSVLIALSVYLIGVLSVMFSGIFLKKIGLFKSEYTPFIMELPRYHLPKIKNVIIHTLDKVKSYVVKAGTVIFVSSVVIWFLSNFNLAFQMVDADQSILAIVGREIAPIFAPLGFGDWRATVATFNGLVAKESVLSALGILFGAGEVSETGVEIWTHISQAFTPIQGYSFLLFNMLCIPCIAAVGAIRREMNSARWTFIALAYQTLYAYTVSFVFYQFALVFAYGSFTLATLIAASILTFVIIVLVRKQK